jgi:hypothetical protein
MQIDNQKNIYRVWLRRMIMAIAFTVLIVILLFVPWFDDPEVRISEFHVIAAIALVYVGINVFLSFKQPHFISYNDKGDMIVFRYYPLSLFNSKKHSIEIPKQHFVKYELTPFFLGMHQKIVLYQHYRERVVGYPPIPLSALDTADREQLLASLEKYVHRH